MNTDRINKVLALARAANPTLPLPLSTDNIDLDDITATPRGTRNTQATMYALDTGDIVRYVGSSTVHYDRIDIAQYWQVPELIEDRSIVTVKDLVAILRTRHGLDVLDSELLNAEATLPRSGVATVQINDAVSPLYIGSANVSYTHDAGLQVKDGMAYGFAVSADDLTPVVAYTDTPVTLEGSVDGDAWVTLTATLNKRTKQLAHRFPQSLAVGARAIRVRGGIVRVVDNAGRYIPITRLTQYRGSVDGTGYFSGIKTLTVIDPDCFALCPGLVSADYMFDGCVGLTTLPDRLFSPCSQLQTATAVFRNTAITRLPENLFESCSRLRRLDMAFEHCTALTQIPVGVFRTTTALETLHRCFANTQAVTHAIPATLLVTLPKLTDASYLFAGCGWVSVVSQGFLQANTRLKSIAGMFSQCRNLDTIPPGLLTGLADLVNVDRLFQGCGLVKSVPPGLFQNCPNLEYAQYTFADTGILTTPTVLFAPVRRLLSIDYIFSHCTKLKEIPPGLLSPLLRLQSANGVWYGCTGITTLPDTILDGPVNVSSLDWVFANTGITAIPGRLFATLAKLVSVAGAFSGTLITSVPAELFSQTPKLVNVAHLFHRCGQLTQLPAGLFATTVNLAVMRATFASTGLTGNIGSVFRAMQSRASLRDISAVFQNTVGLTGSFAGDFKALLSDSSVDWVNADTTQGCVAGVTQLSDYVSVGSVYKTPVTGLV